jgi:broad specificity phosphatase PhoE
MTTPNHSRSWYSRPLAVFALLLAAATLTPAAEPAATRTVILVRHAERASNNGDLPLNEAGRERAALLARLLGHAGITHVFTSEMVRTKETAAPLAARLALAPVVVPVAQRDALVAQLDQLPGGSVALVVNHGGPIPELIQKLGAPAPAAIAEDQFDRLFVVTRGVSGAASVVEMRYGEPPAGAAP